MVGAKVAIPQPIVSVIDASLDARTHDSIVPTSDIFSCGKLSPLPEGEYRAPLYKAMSERTTTFFFVTSKRLFGFVCGLSLLLVVWVGCLRQMNLFCCPRVVFFAHVCFCCGPEIVFIFWWSFESCMVCLRCPLLASGLRSFRTGEK